MEATMMFLDCPAYLDQDGAVRCGLPAEATCRYTMRSTDGPLESARSAARPATTSTGPSNLSPGTLSTTTIRALPGSVLARGMTASSAIMMAVTVAPDPPCGISLPGQSGRFAARTVLPPTTWAALPPCGSPPRAHAAGPLLPAAC